MKKKMKAKFIAYVYDVKGVKHKRAGEIVLFTDSSDFTAIAEAARTAVRAQHDELRGVPIDVREYRHAA
jgi:hypothetical protein